MFRNFLRVFVIFLIFSGPAQADTLAPLEPVQAVVAIAQNAEKAESDGDVESASYLSEDVLKRYFSTAFVDAFEEGSRRAHEKEEPFIDYDPVSGGQVSCPLKDVTYLDPAENEGAFEITIRFKSIYCLDDEFADEVDETRFRVIVENGRPVIDDIVNLFADTDPVSLRQVMDDYFDE